ncbi:MAG: hypothetical protein LBQ64_03275, partial [Bacteroidales bacterium]|nr:hypothetical protein [Bacteroidales bacterium]
MYQYAYLTGCFSGLPHSAHFDKLNDRKGAKSPSMEGQWVVYRPNGNDKGTWTLAVFRQNKGLKPLAYIKTNINFKERFCVVR